MLCQVKLTSHTEKKRKNVSPICSSAHGKPTSKRNENDTKKKSLSAAVLERFETAVLDMDEPGIAAACPLLAPLGLATQGQELYLGFARRALEAQLKAEVGDASPSTATQSLPAIYNVSAAFLRRWVGIIGSCMGGGRGGGSRCSCLSPPSCILLRFCGRENRNDAVPGTQFFSVVMLQSVQYVHVVGGR